VIELDRTLVLTLLIALFGGIVAATAGFGFSLVAAPPLLLLYEPVQVTAMLLILALATRWMLLTDTWQTTNLRTFASMLPADRLGIGIGILIVRAVEPEYIKLLASLVVIVAALLLMRGWRPKHAHDPAAGPVAGLLSGILSPTTGMDGTPVVFLLSSRDYSVSAFRSTSLCSISPLRSAAGSWPLSSSPCSGTCPCSTTSWRGLKFRASAGSGCS